MHERLPGPPAGRPPPVCSARSGHAASGGAQVMSAGPAPAAGPLPAMRGRHQLSEMVAAHVREAIMIGALRAPGYLRTEHLAAELGISATPVREALMILHSEGAVR